MAEVTEKMGKMDKNQALPEQNQEKIEENQDKLHSSIEFEQNSSIQRKTAHRLHSISKILP